MKSSGIIVASSDEHLISRKKTKTLWPLFIDEVQLPQGYSHFNDTVYFLVLSSQKFLVLIYQPQIDKRLSQPWSHPMVLNTDL